MIVKIDNLLPHDLLVDTAHAAENVLISNRYNLSSNFSWNNDIILDSAPVLTHLIDKDSKLYKDLRQCIVDKTDMDSRSEIDIMFYYWSVFSYIPWHDDCHVDSALTLYLNPDWDENWGGYFMYEDGDEVKAIKPQGNMAIYNKTVKHCTTPVHIGGKMRVTMQVFEKRKENE
jgi:Rps23 Pro-64 3,4-dihydroxylase Tpa1-like proline 4-hydroxylase